MGKDRFVRALLLSPYGFLSIWEWRCLLDTSGLLTRIYAEPQFSLYIIIDGFERYYSYPSIQVITHPPPIHTCIHSYIKYRH